MSDTNGYTRLGLAMPTTADLRAGVLRGARGDEAVWTAVCQAARAAPYSGSQTDLLDRLVQAAKDRGGAVGVAAMSFEVRLRNYHTLSILHAARIP